MKPFVKIILGAVLVCFLLIAGVAAVLLTIDPNVYKDQISAAVERATGRDFSITGNIDVSFYPVLGFKAEGLSLGNPPGFRGKAFIKAAQVQAGVKILPLLRKKVDITTVHLTNPEITIIKDADGKTNLSMPRKGAVDRTKTAELDISLEGIDIKDGHVVYMDQAARKTVDIRPFNLKIPRYEAGRDIEVSLDMAMQNQASETPVKMDIKATMNAEPDQGRVVFKNFKSTVTRNGMDISAAADIAVHTKEKRISVTGLNAGWPGSRIEGNIDIKGFTNSLVTFNLSSPTIDLDALPKNAPAGSANGEGHLLPIDQLRKLTLKGTLALETLKVSGLTLNNVRARISGVQAIFNVDPLTADLYDGTLTTEIKINARSADPAFSMKGGLKGIEAGQFLTAKMGDDYLSGIVDADFELDSRGNSIAVLRQNAGGEMAVHFGKGYINKWQLSKLVNQAISYFEKGEIDPNASDKVYFTSLDAQFSGQGGIFRNNDLRLIAPKSHALGEGSINLAAQTVDYVVRVGGGDNPEKFGKKKHLPIRIQGPLQSPSYALDMQALVQEAVGEKIEEKKQEIMEGLFKRLDEKLGNEVTPAPAEPSPDAREAAPPASDPAIPPAADSPQEVAPDERAKPPEEGLASP